MLEAGVLRDSWFPPGLSNYPLKYLIGTSQGPSMKCTEKDNLCGLFWLYQSPILATQRSSGQQRAPGSSLGMQHVRPPLRPIESESAIPD